jgi:hypothetical protein
MSNGENDTESVVPEEAQQPEASSTSDETSALKEQQDREASLLRVGFVNFDAAATDNTTTGAMVSADLRQHFRRDVYVGIRDREQNIDFLGRIVEGPFHAPHEVSQDSAITRTTVLHPDRTQFRPTYYVYGTIEVLGALTQGEHGNAHTDAT